MYLLLLKYIYWFNVPNNIKEKSLAVNQSQIFTTFFSFGGRNYLLSPGLTVATVDIALSQYKVENFFYYNAKSMYVSPAVRYQHKLGDEELFGHPKIVP